MNHYFVGFVMGAATCFAVVGSLWLRGRTQAARTQRFIREYVGAWQPRTQADDIEQLLQSSKPGDKFRMAVGDVAIIGQVFEVERKSQEGE